MSTAPGSRPGSDTAPVEHRLWTEENLPLSPLRPEVLERLRAPVERADILRLEILYTHGGVYLDTDLECLRPSTTSSKARRSSAFPQAGEDHQHRDRGHPRPSAPRPGDARDQAARGVLDGLVGCPQGCRRATAAAEAPPGVPRHRPPRAVHVLPFEQEDRKRAIAVHHMARVWHNTTTLRAAMLRAERRLEKVREHLEARAARARGDEEEARKLQARDASGVEQNGQPADDGEEFTPVRKPRKKNAWLRRRAKPRSAQREGRPEAACGRCCRPHR